MLVAGIADYSSRVVSMWRGHDRGEIAGGTGRSIEHSVQPDDRASIDVVNKLTRVVHK
jgi:hypothetical protein